MAKKSKKKTGIVTVDFTGVEKGFTTVPEGDYKAKPIAAEEGSSDKGDYIAWTFQITEGKYKGQKLLPYYTSLQPQALWNLRGLLEAIGHEVPESSLDLDLEEIIENAEEVSITIEHDKYEGKKRAKIVDIGGEGSDEEDEEEDEEDEDDKPAKKKGKGKKASDDDDEDDDEDEKPKKKSSKKKDEGDDEDEDEDDSDEDEITVKDIMKMDEDELELTVDEFELDVDLDDIKKLEKKRKAVAKAFEAKNADKNDDDDEEEDEGYTQAEVFEMNAKALQKLIDKHKLKIDLEDYSNTRKKRKAVFDALEEKELVK